MKVIIEVYRGVVDCTYKDEGVEVLIIDHDPLEHGEPEDVFMYKLETKISDV